MLYPFSDFQFPISHFLKEDLCIFVKILFLKNQIRQTATFISNAFPFGIIKNAKIPFLPFYHLVTDNTPPHIRHLYKGISPKIFETHLDFFLKHFHPVSKINDFRKKNSFLLSFDDGLRETYEIVYPILKRKGVPTIFFVNPGFVGNIDLMFRYKASLLIDIINKKEISRGEKQQVDKILEEKNISEIDIKTKILGIDFSHRKQIDQLLKVFEIDIATYLKNEKPYANLSELKQMENDGFIIGMHSYNHADFRQLDKIQRITSLQKNIAWHQKNFPHQPKLFAFPFTDDGLPQNFFTQMQSLGITMSFGTAGIKNDVAINHFQRFPVEDYQGNIRQIIGGEYFYSMIRSIFGKNTVRRS